MANELFSSTGLPDHPLVRKAWLKLEVFKLKTAEDIAYLEWKEKVGSLSHQEKRELEIAKTYNFPAMAETLKTLMRNEPNMPPEALAALMSSVTVRTYEDLQKIEATLGKQVRDMISGATSAILDMDIFLREPKATHLFILGAMIYHFSTPQNLTAFDGTKFEDFKYEFFVDTKNVRAYFVEHYPDLTDALDNAFNASLAHMENLRRARRPDSSPPPPAP